MVKQIIVFLIFILISFLGMGQIDSIWSKQLSTAEIDSIFTDSLNQQLGIRYNTYRIYEYNDISGNHFIVMTENSARCDEDAALIDCHDTIMGYCFTKANNTWKKEWQIKDFLYADETQYHSEYSIQFWTKYFKLADFDHDGLIDPIIVYGTLGFSYEDDSRVKIIAFHKGKKRAIRHQNSSLDHTRITQIDNKIKSLPSGMITRLKEILTKLEENGHSSFSSNLKESEFE